MYAINNSDVELIFSLENGLYLFEPEASTGKTRLCKEIRKHQQYGEDIASYSYEDKQSGIDIQTVLNSDQYKVIMLDRYDMYNGDGAELIKECAKHSIVLIDCKSGLNFVADDDLCMIEMTPSKIEVLQ